MNGDQKGGVIEQLSEEWLGKDDGRHCSQRDTSVAVKDKPLTLLPLDDSDVDANG